MLNQILAVILTLVQLSPLSVLGSQILYQRDVKDRILLGKEANPSDFPFIVRLEIGDVLCGGTIIADQWIITSAHCLYKQDCTKLKIFPSTWTPKSASIANALECHIHEKFNYTKNRNDLGMIKTSKNITQDGLTAVIPLPDPGTRFPVGTDAVTLGWGVTAHGIFPEHLMQGNVKMENWTICNSKQKHHAGKCDNDTTCSGPDMSVKVLCTQGDGSSPVSSCSGDSGSSVLVEGVLIGVTSYTLADEEVCLPGAPTMHVSVVDYLPWIYSFIDPDKDTSKMEVLEDPE